jgi:uncharacterized protein YodC (DUF2158 family)
MDRGTVVRLKSGGPLMTSLGTKIGTKNWDDPKIVCEWFHEGQNHVSNFYQSTLIKVENE